MGRSILVESTGESSQRYAARMVYLTEEDEESMFSGSSNMLEPMGRTLKPPCLFMSRRQARIDSALCLVKQTPRGRDLSFDVSFTELVADGCLSWDRRPYFHP